MQNSPNPQKKNSYRYIKKYFPNKAAKKQKTGNAFPNASPRSKNIKMRFLSYARMKSLSNTYQKF